MKNTKTKSDTNKMKEIKNVLLCGLGGVGCVCACAIHNNSSATLKILVDENRYKKYKEEPTIFNEKEYFFNYIKPDNTDFSADLIIIATKDDGLDSAIENIKNFVNDETIIISVLNGILSERKLSKVFKEENIPISFFIGSSCIREGRRVHQNGDYDFIIGDKSGQITHNIELLSSFFKDCNIRHKVSKKIEERYWKKFMVNVGLNQICTVENKTFKEVKQSPHLVERMKKLIWEVKLLAEKEGINNSQSLYDDTMNFLINDFEDATPSMLQDLRAGRKTELDIFAGEIIRLGLIHNIQTPENEKIYKEIKAIEDIKIV